MKKVIKKIGNKEDFDKMLSIFVEMTKRGDNISGNGMFDGMVIGFMLCHYNFAKDLFLEKQMYLHNLDGTYQKME